MIDARRTALLWLMRQRWIPAVLLAFNCLGADTPKTLVLPPVWHWSNPTPHGADVFALIHSRTNGTFVEACEQGQIFSSDDGVSWTPLQSHTTADLQAATFLGGRAVITGEAGAILFSDDLYNWFLVDLSITNWLEGVAASSNLVVAVGDSGAIFTSADAATWQPVVSPFTNWLTGIAYGSNTFVTVGYNGLIATSKDGVSWTTVSSNTKTNLLNVAWLFNQFMAVGAGGVTLASSNGASWHAVTNGATNSLYGVAGGTNIALVAGISQLFLDQTNKWSNQLTGPVSAAAPSGNYYADVWTVNSTNAFVTAGETGLEAISYNFNGSLTWSTPTSTVRSWLWQVMRTPAYYVTVGNYGTIMTSADGIAWEVEYVPPAVTNSVLLGVGGSSNLLLAVGTRGTVLWGTNAFLWNSIPAPTTNDLEGILFDGQYMICGGNGTILTSANGTNWTKRTTPTTSFLSSIAQYPGGWLAVGENGAIVTSTNRTNWKAQGVLTTNWLSSVSYLNGVLIATGENGTILTSTNATVWTVQNSGVSSWLNSADFVTNTWFIAGNDGTILGSQTLNAWARFPTLTAQPLYGLAHNQVQLVAVGAGGVILRTLLIPPTNSVNIANYSVQSGNAVFLFTGVPDQQFFLQSSSDLQTWSQGPLLEFIDNTGTLLYVQPQTNSASALFYRAQAVQ